MWLNIQCSWRNSPVFLLFFVEWQYLTTHRLLLLHLVLTWHSNVWISKYGYYITEGICPFSSSSKWKYLVTHPLLLSSHILFRLDTAEAEVGGISRDKEHLMVLSRIFGLNMTWNVKNINSLRSFEPRAWIQIHLHIHCWSPGQSCICTSST